MFQVSKLELSLQPYKSFLYAGSQSCSFVTVVVNRFFTQPITVSFTFFAAFSPFSELDSAILLEPLQFATDEFPRSLETFPMGRIQALQDD